MSDVIKEIEKEQLRSDELPEFGPGDTIKVLYVDFLDRVDSRVVHGPALDTVVPIGHGFPAFNLVGSCASGLVAFPVHDLGGR